MHCAKHGTVIDLFTDKRNIIHELILVNLTENALAKHCRSLFHLASYRRIIVGEVGMISTRVDNTKRMAAALR